MEIKTFRDLIAWQKAMQLTKHVYQATTRMPDTEKFGLTAQMRRAAVSIPSNIAEGHGRQSLTEYIRFLKVARGSLMELQTQLILSEELNFIQISTALNESHAETDRVLQGLIRSLENLPK
jgi:four helix bundle protein